MSTVTGTVKWFNETKGFGFMAFKVISASRFLSLDNVMYRIIISY